MLRYWYLASPYAKYKDGREAAFRDISGIAAKFLIEGIPVFCPIAHSHAIATIGEMKQVDHEFWMSCDLPFLNRAIGLIVAQLPGWQESRGVTEEIGFAKGIGIPIFPYNPAMSPTAFDTFVNDMRREEKALGYVS